MSLAHHQHHYVPNGCGWDLELKQCAPPKRLHKKRNPIVIIPGYGMNSFIFGYHPHGVSLEEYLRQRGFEVWSINLRAQGGSKRRGGKSQCSLADLALTDLKVALDYVAKESRSQTGKIDLMGCSLGGTLAFIYTAFLSKNRAGALVAIGTPLRWEKVHPILRIAFASPRLIGLVPIIHLKKIAKLFFPLLLRTPILRVYLHKEMVNLDHKELFLETVEDPSRYLNREVAQWICSKDLMIHGKNLTKKLGKVKNPLLCVLANGDGIVPPMTALSAHEVVGSKIKETLVVGTDTLRFAHADLFVSSHSHEMVFKPIADWLLKQG